MKESVKKKKDDNRLEKKRMMSQVELDESQDIDGETENRKLEKDFMFHGKYSEEEAAEATANVLMFDNELF